MTILTKRKLCFTILSTAFIIPLLPPSFSTSFSPLSLFLHLLCLLCNKLNCTYTQNQRSRIEAVVRVLTPHPCGLAGSIPRSGVTGGLGLLFVFILALRVFLQVLPFSSLHKKQTSEISIQPGNSGQEEPPCGMSYAKISSHSILSPHSHCTCTNIDDWKYSR